MTSSTDAVLMNAVNTGAVPNAVAVVADRNGTIYEGAAGPRIAGSDTDPVTPDSRYRIVSMTKTVTTVAALQQVEKGTLELDAPVDTYRPEFADLQVLAGFDGDTPRLRPPVSRATVRHLLTHTAGLGYWFWNADLVKWESVTGTPNVWSGSDMIFTAPLTADPGTKFEYGINFDWLGKVVEAASGTSLDVAVGEGITGPLGMDATAFRLSDEDRTNLVPIHLQADDNPWVASELDLNPQPDYWSGGHGLYSTPLDYLRFQRALLLGGELDGVRILERATVAALFRNQIGHMDFPAEIASADPMSTCAFNVGPGYKWGYGLLLNTDDVPGARKAASGAWAGLCNTYFWIDPTSGITGATYTQTLPFAAPEALAMCADFENALYASL